MNAAQDYLSRRLGPVFAEVAAQTHRLSKAENRASKGVENPNPVPAPAKAYKPSHGGYPG